MNRPILTGPERAEAFERWSRLGRTLAAAANADQVRVEGLKADRRDFLRGQRG